jgi:4'-phosphopantetheinyl transferase
MHDDSARDRVIVWYTRTGEPAVRARLDEYRTLLSADERARASRFVQPGDAMRFVVGRALARTMLARFGDLAPRDWTLIVDEHGRPELARRPPPAPDLRFNLSHTDGLVACAITLGRELGVDVECIERRLTHDVPERYFSPREVADLRALPHHEQHSAFFDYWTLKESYIKARGLGLALPLRYFSFVRSAVRPPSIQFAPELPDDAGSWQFAQFQPSHAHRMAVAVRRRGPDLPIDVAMVVPQVAG